ncbi:zinc-ribbon domain containing protein [Candidatus Accumulibacter vicinus]|uniref:Probable zinc-binding domain-containing protein n=1 Tax=Candidatus Accumulibacter vicinus TaxID=2954382 RepID=A0A084XXK3_9PROT|nr:zinc-ribbon domain containing protein [Candidatus Accumulibacter vicinus]KFB67197.1 MAG: hypothetical protein CAPSK01_003314 [Candidatus Accumulibacter vicinus]
MKSGKQRKLEIKSARLQRATRIQNHPSPLPVDVYSPGIVWCDATRLARRISYGVPAFIERGYYVDIAFRCRDCGAECVWTAAQQKWWYEVAQGNIETRAVRCRPCRIKERERKSQARRMQQEGLQKKQATDHQ